MTKEDTTKGLNITRERMIQLLNEDLAGEYQAIIAYTVYSQVLKGAAYTDIARELEAHAGEELAHAIKIAKQIDYLGGMPGVTPKPVKTSTDPVAMLRADLENERETVGRYRERIRQAEAMGEFALSETLRAIIVQEQELSLIHISEPTRLGMISYAVFCLKKKKKQKIYRKKKLQ